MANPAKAYLATQIETTTQGELLLMLYEAAIKFLKRAKVEIDKKDYAKKGIYISKAMAIIHELSESLNKEKGGDITPRLASLYQFCTSQLLQANIRLDNKRIDDVINILDGLRSAYAQIIPGHEGKSTSPQGTADASVQSQKEATTPTASTSTTQQAAPLAKKPLTSPQPPTAPQQPLKMRSAAAAAKFRAANAYSNSNR
ncbi:flagellar export chaperone FliS [Pseudodesulfovibrio sp. JC047]|uniref:flagellar export chaperone FliS n=1 Tax=Pseudodesulfovibrio sp. JC047 TaxID=2683199 RepID=UPI0013D4F95B|nr:flagellar export chaperone FliS [Pseudodesulfovibrio sp. JC047]NDV17894.1 flagellar export chaperone FliS [Pseudodesulfovibrio sp. JC047]